MKRLLPLIAAATLAACASPSDVTVGIAKLKWEGERIPGRYAATVQSGAWRKEVSAEGFACMGWDFPVDADAAYTSTLRDALSDTFEDVTFTPEMTPPEIIAAGYDGAIIVYQGSFDTSAVAREEPFWSYSAHASVTFDSVVALVGPKGLVGQASPRGSGVSSGEMTDCDDLGGRMARASRMAILALVQQTIAEVRMLAAKN